MTQIIVDRELQSKLRETPGLVALCDESGNTLGYFRSAPRPSDYRNPLDGSPFPEEEIQRRLRERGGRTLPDVLQELRAS